MTIAEVRKLLTKKEMDTVTEKALRNGPFAVLGVRRIGNQLEVEVKYPRDGGRKETISLGD